MARLLINTRYRELLAGHGLRTPRDFLALPGVIYGGHPDRNVAHVALGGVKAFLKREHRVRWKDLLASAWAGFGPVSKSCREYRLLCELGEAGVGCPEAIAAGEDGVRAFLLLREVEGARELRPFLSESASRRRLVLARLGVALARLHAAGFDHADLYSKHVLVHADAHEGIRFTFLDWQRSRRGRPCWTRRRRDLAALDATLSDELATPRDRLALLRAYLYASLRLDTGPAPPLAEAARQVRRASERLLGRRRIRELRQPALSVGEQNLIWLDGEALCVTRQFLAELGGHVPGWLARKEAGAGLRRESVPLPGGRVADLVTRSTSRPLAWLWAWLRRRRLLSPELEQAGLLFRLQRYGVGTPRLLAVGQKHPLPWRAESFLLTEPRPGTVPLLEWLAGHCGVRPREQRATVLREVGAVLRRVHEAGCVAAAASSLVGCLCVHPGDPVEIALAGAEGLRRRHRLSRALARRDLMRVLAALEGVADAGERLQVVAGYHGAEAPRRKQWTEVEAP
jgi:hypothetical protein